MVKDIVIVADLGAAGNLIRNLLLLSNQTHWPLTSNRFDTISNQYQSSCDLSQWLDIEYRLRFWDRYYGIDLSNDIDIKQFCQRRTMSSPVVYLNHSAFYQQQQYQQLKDIVSSVYIAPTTEFGFRWQVRSYCEKRTVEKLHNFTFDIDVDRHRDQYCQAHGVDEYHKLNVKNFAEIIKARQQEFGTPDIGLESLLFGKVDEVVNILQKQLKITIDIDSAEKILAKWQQCHWPLDTTNDWKYFDCNA